MITGDTLRAKPSIARLYELFILDAQTGALRWKIRPPFAYGVKPGDAAGCSTEHGYIRVRVDGHKTRAHHIVWAMTHGEWADQLDHINGNGADNRACNLRSCTHSENMRNRGINKNNTSGVKGVCFDKREGKWSAEIMVDRKAIRLGKHDDLELAALIVDEARRKYHGAFARAA